MEQRLGLSAGAARDLAQEARAVDPAKLRDFIAPLMWMVPARCSDVGGAWRCRTRARLEGGVKIETVDVVPSVPARTRVVVRRAGDRREIAVPGMVLVADGTTRQEVRRAPVADVATVSDLGVLIDLPSRRIFVGPPMMLASTYADLLYLDGRYTHAFAKVDEHVWPGRERVVTWQIDWAYTGER